MIRSSWFLGVLCACVVVVAPTMAQALEVNFGLSVGGIQVGTEPRLAVSPFLGFLWHTEGGFLFEVHNMFSILSGEPCRSPRSHVGNARVHLAYWQHQSRAIPVFLLDASV